MACGCNKARAASAGGSADTLSGTYRVIVSGKQVYESSSQEAADTVAGRFETAEVLAPGTPNP